MKENHEETLNSGCIQMRRFTSKAISPCMEIWYTSQCHTSYRAWERVNIIHKLQAMKPGASFYKMIPYPILISMSGKWNEILWHFKWKRNIIVHSIFLFLFLLECYGSSNKYFLSLKIHFLLEYWIIRILEVSNADRIIHVQVTLVARHWEKRNFQDAQSYLFQLEPLFIGLLSYPSLPIFMAASLEVRYSPPV